LRKTEDNFLLFLTQHEKDLMNHGLSGLFFDAMGFAQCGYDFALSGLDI
jgi:hypothetical protein